MTSIELARRTRAVPLVLAFSASFVSWAGILAAKTIDEHLAVDPQGSVEIVNVAGKVDVSGWERAEIEVTGSVGERVERVDVSANGSSAVVRVVANSESGWGDGISAHLTVRVPVKCAITVSLVSSDLHVEGVQGAVKLQTVSGDVGGSVGGDLRANSVTGNIRLIVPAAKLIEARTVSGDIELSGAGAAGGSPGPAGGSEVEIATISGDAKVDVDIIKRGRFKSVSGDLTANFALAAAGQVEGESVSGSLSLRFSRSPGAQFDVQTLSGSIDNCFGPKPVEPRYGPGSRLLFKNGDGGGRVQMETKSGDVHLCDQDPHGVRSERMSSAAREPRLFPLL